mgnify:CR=1 FL=1
MPINKSLYPPNWNSISLQVRSHANWTCEQCSKPCRQPGQSWDEFHAYLLHDVEYPWFGQAAEELPTGEFKYYPTRFVLTVAHLDGNPSNCKSDNLKALCAPCHLRLDVAQHVRSRKHGRYKSREQSGQLFFL